MKPVEWKETEARVFICGWQDKYSAGATGLQPDGSYLITFSYEVDGHWYSGKFLRGSPLVEGSKFLFATIPKILSEMRRPLKFSDLDGFPL